MGYNIIERKSIMSYTNQELQEAVTQSKSHSEALRKLGRNSSGSAHKCLRQRIEQNNIDISHFNYKPCSLLNNIKKHYSEILIFDKQIKNRRDHKQLKRALLEFGRQYICEECGINKWNDKDIILEIDHIDGNWRNNQPNNLRFLCPNCHSQTTTFYKQKTNKCIDCQKPIHSVSIRCVKCSAKIKGLKNRIVERPPIEQIQKEVDELGYVGTGRKYGVSDNAIRKWLGLKK